MGPVLWHETQEPCEFLSLAWFLNQNQLEPTCSKTPEQKDIVQEGEIQLTEIVEDEGARSQVWL